MPASPTTHPSAEQLQAYALGKIPAAQLETIAQHLETCPQCLDIAGGRHADSFIGKLRAAHPQAATAGWAPQDLLDARTHTKRELTDLPPELRDSMKYRIERELGRGGMGVIYLAEHRMMGKRVALKVINQTLLSHPDAQARFLTEVRAAARLDHPNIVKALDADRLGALHLLVMDFVDGLSLAEVLQRKGPFPVVHACNYIRQAALGLQHAFEQGMVHRDIKPQNLMLTRDGKVKILDFGLARIARERPLGKPGLTQVGDFMGTPEYVAPEQAMDASSADIRADLYSLGCTLYYLLAGRPPFRGDTQVQTIMAHLEKEAPPLPAVRPDVPAPLWAVVARVLAKDPAKRYETPVEFAQALAPFCKPGSKQPAAPKPAPASSPHADTKVRGDTSHLPERQKPAVPVATVVVPAPSPFAEFDEPAALDTPRSKPQPGKFADRRKLAIGAGIGVLLLAVGGWLLSGVIFRVRTPDGTVVLQVDQPGAEVLVDGEKVQVTWGAGGKKAEIHVKPGTHKLSVVKDGFKTFGDEVKLEDGGRQILTVRFERTPSRPAISKLPPASTPADGFLPLFIGKDLTGWQGNPQLWSVQGGALVGSTFPKGIGYNTFLCSKETYKDFELKFQVYLKDGNGNSGVQIRSKVLNSEKFIVGGPQADIGDGYWGSLYGEQFGGMMKQSPSEAVKRVVKSSDFNDYHIKCVGKHVTIAINGETMVDDDFASMPEEGVVAWQLHAGGPMEVTFRNIQFKNLTLASGLLASTGFVPLFNGKDLTGWHVESGNAGQWTVEEDAIVGRSPEWKTRNYLLASSEYADFTLRFEFMISPGSGGGVALRAIEGEKMPLNGIPMFDHPLVKLVDSATFPAEAVGMTHWVKDDKPFSKPREELQLSGIAWYTMEITVRGDACSVLLDKKKIVDIRLEPQTGDATRPALKRSKGRIGFQTHTGTIRLRRVQIKELPPTKTEAAPVKPAPPAENVTEQQLRQRIEAAWPGLGSRLSKDKAGDYTLYLRGCEKQVTDLMPLQGMPLTTLNVTYNDNLHDLTPLQGMKLKSLSIGRCQQIRDLRPLQGMDLDFLDLAQCNGLDLRHLKGMKIKLLSIWNRGSNEQLRALQGVHLNGLIASGSPIDDLTPLQGMALNELVLNDNGRLANLTPLQGLPLAKLNIKGCDKIVDITPLKDVPLQEIVCDFKSSRDTEVLRSIKTLESINGQPAREFLKRLKK
jgi:serine/threonine protein kinase